MSVQVRSDPKPQRRIIDRAAGRRKVEREGRCRVTGGRDCLTRFHLVARGSGGDDVDPNIIPVRFGEHMTYEDRAPGWETVAAKIRASLEADELAYILEKKGADWLEHNYPESV